MGDEHASESRAAGVGGPTYLGVEAVMARYGLRDRRAARRVMDAAGAFAVGRRLYVTEADLVAHEERLRAARRAQAKPVAQNVPTTRQRDAGDPASPARLGAGWWREPTP